MNTKNFNWKAIFIPSSQHRLAHLSNSKLRQFQLPEKKYPSKYSMKRILKDPLTCIIYRLQLILKQFSIWYLISVQFNFFLIWLTWVSCLMISSMFLYWPGSIRMVNTTVSSSTTSFSRFTTKVTRIIK